MILVDTSVWIEVLRDSSGEKARAFRKLLEGELPVLCRFTQLELLQGARNDSEWKLLHDYLLSQYYLEACQETWPWAARIYFDLRSKGLTVRSPIDCCIAQLALERDILLLHRDKDFEAISRVRPLRQERF